MTGERKRQGGQVRGEGDEDSERREWQEKVTRQKGDKRT